MHTYIKYDAEDPAVNDANALKDVKEYLGARRWKIVKEAAKASATSKDVQNLNYAMAFAGITGFPFYAFCRKYCPKAYMEWRVEHGMED
jgi:parvulin-like peptidyl-prolyl isomerase